MNAPQGPVAPESDGIPTFEQLAADPEIAALLDFEPVAMRPRVNGWTADAQRGFVAALAATGSKYYAAEAVGRTTGGIERILKRADADSLRTAVDRAFAHARGRHGALLARNVANVSVSAPVPRRGRKASGEKVQLLPEPGQVMNELGEWEDQDSYARRGDEAMDNMLKKLLRVRRLYLADIGASPAKRAAFEILTEYEVDWDKAALLEPQDDEPWRTTNQREPDMILMADGGWSFGDVGYGLDRDERFRELLREVNAWRVERGLEAVEWDGADPHPNSSPAGGRGRNAAERQEGEGL